MKPLSLAALFVVLAAVAAPAAQAQDEEERIVVTGSRITVHVPGVVLERRADSLLLEIRLVNDSIEPERRREELTQTLDNLLKAAERDKLIEVSAISSDGYVLPFDPSSIQLAIQNDRSRRDTSYIDLRIKTAVPKKNASGPELVARIRKFTASIKKVGRTLIEDQGEIAISIVNPDQYRSTVLKLVTDEIKTVTAQLGPGYKVQLTGISEPLTWVQAGPLDVFLFIPYSYTVLPETIHTVTITQE